MDKIHVVPYFSQYLDINNKNHLVTACGMTCVYMGLCFYGANGDSSLDDLVEKGMREGGYGRSGWLHDYLVQTFVDHSVSCTRREQMHDRDTRLLGDALRERDPVIISMQRFSFDRRIFHMVILVGYRENSQGELEGFFYHDPAGLVREEVTNLFVSIPVFLQYWRRMAIFPSRNGQ